MIPTNIEGKKYRGLVDTGASRSCRNEQIYHNLNLPKSSELSEIRVSSATGTPIEVLGAVECSVTLGKCEYQHKFIVCRNIKRTMIRFSEEI